MRRIGLDGRIHYVGPFLAPGDGGGGAGVPDDDSDLDKLEDLGDAGKAAIKAERAARRKADADAKAAADALKTAADRLTALEEADRKRTADAATQAEKDREAKGEFESLAKERENERDKAKAELAALQAQFDALKTAANTVVKADFETLPEAVRDVYTGDKDDAVAMLAFIPKGKKLVESLAKQGEGDSKTDSSNVKGAEENPKANGATGGDRSKEDAAALAAFRASYS
jgi:hypothetical protein